MPYKNPADKAQHNKKYKSDNKALLEVQRLKRSSQKSITKKTFDLIKDIADDELLARFKIMKTLNEKVVNNPSASVTLETTQQTTTPITPSNNNESVIGSYRGSKEGFWTGKAKSKKIITIGRVKDLFALIPYNNAATKKKEKSYLNNIPKIIGCPNKDTDNFMCVYKDLSKTVKSLSGHYETPMDQTNFLLKLINNSKEIRENVSEKDYIWLDKTTKDLQRKKNATTIEKNKTKGENTDWELEYENMVNFEPKTEDMKVFQQFLLNVSYDDKNKLSMIPRNYFIGEKQVKIITSVREANDKDNFYVPRTGFLIINNYKTGESYFPYKYKLNTKLKKLLNDSIKKGKWNILFPKLGNDFPNAVGVSVHQYRRIIKAYAQRKMPKSAQTDYTISVAMGHNTTTGQNVYNTG